MRTVAPLLSLSLIIKSVFERSCDNASLSDFEKLSLSFTSNILYIFYQKVQFTITFTVRCPF